MVPIGHASNPNKRQGIHVALIKPNVVDEVLVVGPLFAD